MQYALLNRYNDNIRPLIDAHEIYALEQGLDNLTLLPCDKHYEQSLTRQVVYGVYKPQPDAQFPKSEIKRHIFEALDKWLYHIDGLTVIQLGIEDIELFSDITIMNSCGHCPTPHKSDDIAFAALLLAPTDFNLGTGKTAAKTAFLRWDGVDPLTTLLNRKGLFSLIAPEKRKKTPPTIENWHSFIDTKRAIQYAQKWR
ncbi:hypothetical protein DZ860_21060 [Vibrio sinensis]|uniref:Uncharacterized protein n=1 Tax=Vibrio sinensis TaxID=2302434 RepID=A0A3A6QBT1_9VIBR|nr:hypothetical protein [Vibrio sinensis]RJX65851.1 hypothetical protein DZ860_21060 [Vibrio sinensis]